MYKRQVRQWQTLFYEKHYAATVLDDGVDYVKLSEAMGATARRVKTQEEFEKAFADALKLSLIHICSWKKAWRFFGWNEAESTDSTGTHRQSRHTYTG